LSWRTVTDRVKRSERLLRVADFMGRGRGRARFLDHLNAPPAAPLKPDLSNWQDQPLAATWLGHATVLLRVRGLTILTDPVLGNRVGIGLGLITGGPRRHVLPALGVRELPPIDVILISHAHYDHLCRPTLVRLPKGTPVVSSFGTSDLIRDLGFRQITELRWGESTTVEGVTFTAQKVRHWGARTFYDDHRGYNAYLIEGGGRRVLYGGDTAYQDYFKEVDGVDLAVLGIGGYDPFLGSHATPEQAWEMMGHMGAEFLLPMHHSTFRLSHEPTGEPVERLLTVAGKEAERIVMTQVGGIWTPNGVMSGVR
jgi:L-ascorbate metabolism protein UlaG (beta-lactamase superfamily)